MRYKKLTPEQIIISLDRLTRFKPTSKKYFRVFTDIITSNLIEPHYKKNELASLDAEILKNIVETIFNGSLKKESTIDLTINKLLENYENSIFNNDSATKCLLDNKINFKSALELIPQDCCINLQWLKTLSNCSDLSENRERYCLKYPIEKIILVEGITEEILLPAFSRFLGYDFYKCGIQVIAAGGKNQVVKMYYELIEQTKLPIFLLLDKDAEENLRQIQPKLREIDKIHLVSCGEFEDLLSASLIIKTINLHLANFNTISMSDLDENLPNVVKLENIFKTKGLHEFKKAEFAKLVRDNITEESDISIEIREIIKEIFEYNKTLDSKLCS